VTAFFQYGTLSPGKRGGDANMGGATMARCAIRQEKWRKKEFL
jgi:hypothetical protein